jgi:O-antigen/teichoic acid export membrane protein
MSLILSYILNKSPWLNQFKDKLSESPIGYRLAKGAFWSLAGAVISRGLALVASIIVARILGKQGFGELGIIQSTVGMFGVFAGFGMGMTATKHVAEFRIKDPVKARHIIALSSLVAIISGAFMSILLLVFSPWIAANTLAAPHLTSLLQASAGLLFLSAINGAQTGALAGFEAFKSIAKVNLLAGTSSFPLMVGGTFIGGLNGAVWGLVLSMAVNCLANYIALHREAKISGVHLGYSGCFKEWPVLWSFSVPAVLSGAMVGPANWICGALLVNQKNGYTEMGIYNAANQWFWALYFLPNIICQVVLPILSERIGLNDNFRSSTILKQTIKLNAIIVMPLVIVGCLSSPLIMQFYGQSFREGWPTLGVVLITAGLLSIQLPVGNIIAASGRMWLGFLMNMGWGVIFIGIAWLTRNSGSLGLASARGIAYLFHAIWTFGFAYYYLKSNREAIIINA